MTEPTVAPTAPDNQPPTASPTGTDPEKNGSEPTTSTTSTPDFDPSKLSDENLTKVLEDQRLWNTPRLKELREQAKKAKEYDAAQAKLADEQAIKKGEFDKVLSERDAQIKALTDQINNGQLDNALRDALTKAGVTNANAGLKLIDRSKLTMGENGQLEGLEDAMKSFESQYPELLTTNTTSISSPTNPTNTPTGQPVKMSDMRNATWFNDPANAETIKQVQMGKIAIVND